MTHSTPAQPEWSYGFSARFITDRTCTNCQEPITDGEIRYAGDRIEHRHCCAQDPQWALRDQARAGYKLRHESVLSDLKALMNKHQVDVFELENFLEDLQKNSNTEA